MVMNICICTTKTFSRPCDARIEGRLLGDPTLSPTPPPTPKPTISLKPVEEVRFVIGKHNFCGYDYIEASDNCDFGRHCPSGNK